MNKLLIVTGGNRDLKQYHSLIQEKAEGFKVIGVDAGALWLVEHGLTIDLAVGDFDTIGAEGLLKLKEQNVEIYPYQAEKDETDTELAVHIALAQKPDYLILYGGIGSRADHSLANLQLLWKCADIGIIAEIIDPWNRIRVINREVTVSTEFPFISLIPCTSRVEGVTLKGFKYPLDKATLEWGKSLGVSNQLVDEVGEIRVESGWLYVIESKDTI